MEAKREFRGSDTHGVLQRFGADIRATSEGHGWSSIYASIQRENPFEGRFEAIADDLIVLHRSGPVETTFASGGHVTSRCIPKGSIFFLPAGHACEVGLRGALDTLHIYLRANLVSVHNVTPLLVERDVIIQHLAQAVEQAVCEKVSNSDRFIDPIARALADRVSAISRSSEPWQVQTAGLPDYELRRLNDFIEANLEGEITLAAMASACGIGGCPFAPKATGNIATDDLVYMLERMGHRTGIDLSTLLPTAAFLGEQLGHEVPALLPRAGAFP